MGPDYDLPTKRDKTNLESYEQSPQAPSYKLQDPKGDAKVDWDKLKKKVDDPTDPSKIVLGTGKRSGIKDLNLLLGIFPTFLQKTTFNSHYNASASNENCL